MRRLVVLLALSFALTACSEVRERLSAYSDKPGSSASVMVPLALTTPPLNNIIFGPCNEEFAMPESRRANCDIYYGIRFRESPWHQQADRARIMAYGPGELQCWRTLGTAECIVIAGPPRPVNIVAPNMGSN